jgi:hypothetical protein
MHFYHCSLIVHTCWRVASDFAILSPVSWSNRSSVHSGADELSSTTVIYKQSQFCMSTKHVAAFIKKVLFYTSQGLKFICILNILSTI